MCPTDPATVREFLQSRFNPRVDNVKQIGAGMFSQAFAFADDERGYVMRVSECLDDFQKDAFAREHFTAPGLPIPRIVHIDRFDNTRYFCITEHCAGRTLTERETDARVAAQLFDTLDVIHCTNVSQFIGWGIADANGTGRFDSWQNYLATLFNQKFDYDWAASQRLSFWDQNLFEEFFQAMKRLLDYCPSERFLYHGDFGFDNVLMDDLSITGAIDWAEFGYGDFLYDIAYLDYFSQNIPYGDLWMERAQASGRVIPNFHQRIQCYMLNIGLHDMAIAATLNRERAYIRARERTRSVLLPTRRAPTD